MRAGRYLLTLLFGQHDPGGAEAASAPRLSVRMCRVARPSVCSAEPLVSRRESPFGNTTRSSARTLRSLFGSRCGMIESVS